MSKPDITSKKKSAVIEPGTRRLGVEAAPENPFVAFSEWASAADEMAYLQLALQMDPRVKPGHDDLD
jgi:hypothetical protein